MSMLRIKVNHIKCSTTSSMPGDDEVYVYGFAADPKKPGSLVSDKSPVWVFAPGTAREVDWSFDLSLPGANELQYALIVLEEDLFGTNKDELDAILKGVFPWLVNPPASSNSDASVNPTLPPDVNASAGTIAADFLVKAVKEIGAKIEAAGQDDVLGSTSATVLIADVVGQQPYYYKQFPCFGDGSNYQVKYSIFG
jgi:hypothetical protein